MSGGVLQFTLGLESSKFLGEIQHATGHLGHMFAEGIEGAIETGARFEHLSRRTGETVGNLYGLEKAFKATGLAGDAVGSVLFQMNKALGGFSEFGAPTRDIFAGLGLDVEKLKAAGGPEALFEITGALAKLNNAEAAKAASLIFGRGGAGDALQLARSGSEGREAFEASRRNGEIVERNAESWAKIERSVDQVKSKQKGLFLGIAEGAAPGIQAVLDVLKKIDLVPLGEKIGSVIGSIGNMFAQGGLGDVGTILTLSLQVGVEKAAAYIGAVLGNPGFWAGIWEVAVGGLGILGTLIIKQVIGAFTTTNSLIFKALGVNPETVDKVATDQSRKIFSALGLDDNLKTGAGFIGSGLKNLGPALQAGADVLGETSPASEKLAELFEKYKLEVHPTHSALANGKLKDTSVTDLNDAADKARRSHSSTVDALTRIGFNSGSNATQLEHARATASHTRTLVDLTREALEYAKSTHRDFSLGNIS